MLEEIEDTTMYRVALTARGEYFLWPAYRAIPAGWEDEGTTGLKTECLAYIEHKRAEQTLRRQAQEHVAVLVSSPQVSTTYTAYKIQRPYCISRP